MENKIKNILSLLKDESNSKANEFLQIASSMKLGLDQQLSGVVYYCFIKIRPL